MIWTWQFSVQPRLAFADTTAQNQIMRIGTPAFTCITLAESCSQATHTTSLRRHRLLQNNSSADVSRLLHLFLCHAAEMRLELLPGYDTILVRVKVLESIPVWV